MISGASTAFRPERLGGMELAKKIGARKAQDVSNLPALGSRDEKSRDELHIGSQYGISLAILKIQFRLISEFGQGGVER